MVNVKGALVSRDVFVVFGQWDMGTMQHMISGDGLPWNDPLELIEGSKRRAAWQESNCLQERGSYMVER
jgi:hypothetical protein